MDWILVTLYLNNKKDKIGESKTEKGRSRQILT